MKRIIVTLLVIGLCGCNHPSAKTTDDLSQTGIAWHDWSPEAFAQAKKENKLVLLHLGAGWCHWCHVMEHVTYRDPQVVSLINAHYVAIHVDQDSRPDLSNRYEDYGWPATILFDANGKELVKFRGYIEPQRMRTLLQATVDDPTPGPSALVSDISSGNSVLSAEQIAMLAKRFDDVYDPTQTGWGNSGQKALQWDALEYEMTRAAAAGDKQADERARATLDNTRKLIDPIWGGIYQYSTDSDWAHPHFEKIMQFQAEGLRIYAMAYSLWHDEADLASAKAIDSFLENFLRSPDGAFFTSEDADVIPGQHSADYFALDDAARRKIGVPRIDKHIFARENAWAARGLVAMYAASGDEKYLSQAKHVIDWVATNRALPDGGFRHDEVDVAGPYLGDNLAMSQAYLAMYAATGQRKYVDAAEATLAFIDQHFKMPTGYASSQPTEILPATQEFDENVSLARTANLIYQYTGNDQYKQMADRAMRYVAAVADSHFPPGTLLAANEISRDPMHVTIVGAMNDPLAASLHQAALSAPISYLRLDWYDPSQGSPLRDDIQYPTLSTSAAFLCSNGACSSPITEPQKLAAKMRQRNRLAN
jgi:uncharacterized protein YyaL (SSP411 family)